ncbi:hypothetical protein IHQ68_16105 [Chelatococcus sambhunathii]|uniref:Uncharacterized protein n=1 Tax=Chelatococcus sambhunathii TaxID=363953 RepID=A0ABU1DJ36_9HYPH|nr:hypothetical protein [Chelatococcus sambhunathii]MDR4308144.1 hypothetical protein [Chelatococcus sambhunathii]
MTAKTAPLRKILSIAAGAATLVAIFAAAALLGALVANATSPALPSDGRLAFSGVSYDASCWSGAAGIDDFGNGYTRQVSVCD